MEKVNKKNDERPAEVKTERRRLSDRRKKPTNPFSLRSFQGHRKTVQRLEDRRRHPYTDQYDLRVFLISILIVLLCCADALYTIFHVSQGKAVELNPLMDRLLKLSPHIFYSTKFTLTALCVLMLVLYKHYPMGRSPIGSVAVIYSIVVLYQFFGFFL